MFRTIYIHLMEQFKFMQICFSQLFNLVHFSSFNTFSAIHFFY